MGKMTDRQIDMCLSRLAQGDTNALYELYQEFHKPIFLFSMSIVHNYHLAEDVSQESFIRIYSACATYKLGTKPRSWMFGIVRHICMDSFRKVAREKELIEIEAVNFSNRQEISESRDEMYRIDNDVLFLLHTLNENEKKIVTLRFYGDLKLTEISELLNMPYKKIRSTYYYALKKLRKAFTDTTK